ncbi:MAG TPA: DUF3048 domain-containing protein [Candidatus Paceibacterota bacterium]|nr:DUF3048 domain-containing protein [Candidatus Paceibacterota bacterium]
MNRLNINTILWVIGTIVLASIIYFFIWWNQDIRIINAEIQSPISTSKSIMPANSLTGMSCPNAGRRPVAVMLPGDAVDRPLSSIGMADVVVEMPVNSKGVTRAMAIFQCEAPAEIGPVRSARADFLPLAASFNVIYAHWGGERGVLDQLNSKLLDNIDGLVYEGTTYYRIPGIKAPHNGFTTYSKLIENAVKAGYSFHYIFAGYPHQEGKPVKNLSSLVTNINIPYESPYQVTWTYEKTTNTYVRTRDNKPEIDKLNNQQVRTSVVAVLETHSVPFEEGQYLEVDTKGQGKATIYQNGTFIQGTWEKDPSNLKSKLLFLDSKGQEIKFTPGKIWIEYIINS